MRKFIICGVLVSFFSFVGISVACDCEKSLSLVERCPSCERHAVRERIIERPVVERERIIEREVAVEHACVNTLAVRTPRTPIRSRFAERRAVRASLHSCGGAQTVLLQTSHGCAGH